MAQEFIQRGRNLTLTHKGETKTIVIKDKEERDLLIARYKEKGAAGVLAEFGFNKEKQEKVTNIPVTKSVSKPVEKAKTGAYSGHER